MAEWLTSHILVDLLQDLYSPFHLGKVKKNSIMRFFEIFLTDPRNPLSRVIYIHYVRRFDFRHLVPLRTHRSDDFRKCDSINLEIFGSILDLTQARYRPAGFRYLV